MLIRRLNGWSQEAILLAARANLLRVAIPGQGDAVEFRRVAGMWFGETDEPVLIDFEDESPLDRTAARGWAPTQLDAPVN